MYRPDRRDSQADCRIRQPILQLALVRQNGGKRQPISPAATARDALRHDLPTGAGLPPLCSGCRLEDAVVAELDASPTPQGRAQHSRRIAHLPTTRVRANHL